jgi:hypothetical protein
MPDSRFSIFNLSIISQMLSESFYQERVKRYAQEEAVCARQNTRYSFIRLIIMLVAFTAGIYCFQISIRLSVAVTVTLLVIFAVCLKRHLAIIEKQKEKERLKTINQQELQGLAGDYSAYHPGEQYMNVKHYYTSDLDIFGTHSLFRFLNRTTSPSGSDMLAEWLSGPAATPEIEERQGAVKELAGMVDMRQQMQAVGLKYRDVSKELPQFLKWLHAPPELLGNKRLLTVMQTLPWITVAAIVAAVFGRIPSIVAWLPVAVHFIISGSVAGKVNYLHRQVSEKVKFISTYSELISIFAGTDFSSPCLVAFRNRFIESKAADQIKTLQNRIRKLDYRLNMLYIPVNILFFFDYKHLAWLERWRSASGQKLTEWFDAIARVEALSSFANMQHNHPGWVMPVINDDYFTLEAKNIGHPLIPEKERVCNDFSLTGKGHVSVVTGSNMSGKSTFERSIGVNMILALAGAPVCADCLAITNCRLYTYMRIADNLEERTSSFYAELKRLKKLIDITKEDRKVFFLLDEVLRGTNSRDRQTGSTALIRQLVRQQVSGIIATHDLSLGKLEEELPDNITNAHFDVQIHGEDMSFDYKLYKGICTSLNASVLMRKIGINIEE